MLRRPFEAGNEAEVTGDRQEFFAGCRLQVAG